MLKTEKTGSVFSDCDDVSDPEGNVSESVRQSMSEWGKGWPIEMLGI